MMGIWFVGAALGNLFAGLVGGRLESMQPDALFRSVAITTGVVAAIAIALAPQVKKLVGSGGIEGSDGGP
jgi:POT family proton-dependent oligopeptide transporter